MTMDPSGEPTNPVPPNPLPHRDIDDQWQTERQPKGVHIRLPIAIATIAVVALVGIWGGAQLKGNNASASVTASSQGGQRNGQRGNGEFPFRGYGGPGAGQGQAGANGRGASAGTVQSINGNTITLMDAQGQTQTITLQSNANITKTTTGSASDITPGETIVVRQMTDSSGATVQVITIGNGAFPGFGGGGFGQGNNSNSASSSSGN
jgi:hypothetical protein